MGKCDFFSFGAEIGAESASDSKILQNARKIKENRRLREARKGLAGVGWGGPGGRRGGCIFTLRAESDILSGAPTRLQQGLAVFNRSAHSAGPGEWKRIKGKEVKGRGKKEYGGGETDKARRMREPT